MATVKCSSTTRKQVNLFYSLDCEELALKVASHSPHIILQNIRWRFLSLSLYPQQLSFFKFNAFCCVNHLLFACLRLSLMCQFWVYSFHLSSWWCYVWLFLVPHTYVSLIVYWVLSTFFAWNVYFFVNIGINLACFFIGGLLYELNFMHNFPNNFWGLAMISSITFMFNFEWSQIKVPRSVVPKGFSLLGDLSYWLWMPTTKLEWFKLQFKKWMQIQA